MHERESEQKEIAIKKGLCEKGKDSGGKQRMGKKEGLGQTKHGRRRRRRE